MRSAAPSWSCPPGFRFRVMGGSYPVYVYGGSRGPGGIPGPGRVRGGGLGGDSGGGVRGDSGSAAARPGCWTGKTYVRPRGVRPAARAGFAQPASPAPACVPGACVRACGACRRPEKSSRRPHISGRRVRAGDERNHSACHLSWRAEKSPAPAHGKKKGPDSVSRPAPCDQEVVSKRMDYRFLRAASRLAQSRQNSSPPPMAVHRPRVRHPGERGGCVGIFLIRHTTDHVAGSPHLHSNVCSFLSYPK